MKRFHILVNQVERSDQGRQLFDRLSSVANKHLDVSLIHLGSIPHDPYMKRAVHAEKPQSTLILALLQRWQLTHVQRDYLSLVALLLRQV